MSVSYHLVPVDKKTNTLVDFHSLGKNINNDFSLFAELMFNHSDRILYYFDKHELVFDFIYSLNQSEISKITYEPEHPSINGKIIQKLKAFLNISCRFFPI